MTTPNTPTIEEQRKSILETQKELMDAIMLYQINNGSESVAWNVSVSFVKENKK